MSPRSILACLLVLAGLSINACQYPNQAEALPVANQLVEFRLVAPTGSPSATAFDFSGTTLHLEDAAPYTLASVYRAKDGLGLPALGFKIDEADKQAFKGWSEANVNRQLAILVDGEVITLPVINDALPGEGVISGGPTGLSEADLERFIELLTRSSALED